MTKPIDPFCRIYWRVLADERFDDIRADMRLFGSWALMLLVADMAYPAPAFVPPTIQKSALRKLVDVGLIVESPGGLYRVHGMKAERDKRTPAGPAAEPDGNPTGTGAEPDGTLARAHQAKPSHTNTTDDSKADARDSLDRYHELTNFRPWNQWSGDALLSMEMEYGQAETLAALDAENAAGASRDDLLKRTGTRLARDADHARREMPKVPKARKPPEDRAAINAEIRRLMAEPPETA